MSKAVKTIADIMIEVKDMERRISILELQAEVERLRAGLHLMAAFNTAILDILNRKLRWSA